MSHVASSLVDLSQAASEKRQSRWRWFQILFALVYTGVVLDVATTALGYARSGSRYEQNPLGGSLIDHLGWFGLLAVLTALCLICYLCVRIVYSRMSLRWSILINAIMILIAAFRWLAVGTAIAYLVQTTS
jgi:NADH:ubiquinone oxidoreductase subunit 6 (subunit J)